MPYGLPFSTSGRGVGATLVLLAIFAGLVVIVGVLLTQVGHSMRVGTVLLRLQDTTAEIRVRMTVALLIGFVALAERFGLKTILGAFLAGAVVSLLDRDSASHPHFRIKLDAIGYGFLVRSSLSQGASGSIAGPARPALGAAPRSCVLTCAAGGPRSASAALPIRPRPPRDHRGGATAGNLAAVPRDRGNQHAGWHDLLGSRRRVDMRWPTVGRDLPGGCPLKVA